MVLLSVYWGIEPGGAAGYAGTVFGGASLGRIWGLSTLIIMGIGPSFGTFMGAFLFDMTGTYTTSLYFGLGAYIVSTIFAILLHKMKARSKPASCLKHELTLKELNYEDCRIPSEPLYPQ